MCAHLCGWVCTRVLLTGQRGGQGGALSRRGCTGSHPRGKAEACLKGIRQASDTRTHHSNLHLPLAPSL